MRRIDSYCSIRSALSHPGYFEKRKGLKSVLVNILSIVLLKVDLSYSRRRAKRDSMRSERWSFAWMNLNHINSGGNNDWHVLCLDSGVASNIIHYPIGQLSWRHCGIYETPESLTKARTMFSFSAALWMTPWNSTVPPQERIVLV